MTNILRILKSRRPYTPRDCCRCFHDLGDENKKVKNVSAKPQFVNEMFVDTGRCSGQTGTVPGTNGTRPRDKPGQTSRFLLNSTIRSPFCPVCLWDGWGVVPCTIVPQGPSEKCLCVLCLLLSAPKSQRFLRFAIAMPIADPRNRSDFRDKRKQCCTAI